MSVEGLYLKYFVLKPHGADVYAEASRRAILAYAEHIVDADPQLARQLRLWVEAEAHATAGGGAT